MQHAEFPIADGLLQLTDTWQIHLAEPMNRRVQNDDLVLWRTGVTIWVAAWNNEAELSRDERIRQLRERVSKDARDVTPVSGPGWEGFVYRLTEGGADKPSFTTTRTCVADGSTILATAYADTEDARGKIENVLATLSIVDPSDDSAA